ncbi:hypothetical protein L873DRAFT_1239130 [Choiromyces venosus 120613-1]|uniref:Uncharacterized protein n=1 Tax=Choiromyces venosus 120613-1 TaxID=1336337 RepID=A0A3N4JDP0_9PEZI|nr:hypothetical protein L873DRAFT_1239130 [Choiromyces venosus 120613-1]
MTPIRLIRGLVVPVLWIRVIDDSLSQQKPAASCFATWLVNSGTMADKLDPHHLVALMSYVFRGKQDGSSRFLDPTSVNPEYNVTNKRETSIRTFPVLDAIASISVFEERSQVVAVALQLNSKERQIRLTIAENREVEPSVVDHLYSVWGKLQALSNEFAAKGGSDTNGEGSPDIPGDVALPLRVNIFREIYQFSLEKQMKRVTKWWSRLLDFVKELAKRRGEDLQGVESNLYYVVAGLHSVLQLVRRLHRNPTRGLTDDEWEVVHDHSMWANENVGLVLADRKHFGCEILAQELNDSPSSCPKDAFRLRHALEKLTSLTHHIECLISFAGSPLLRPALQYHMSISTVPGQTRTVELPGSQEQWKPFLEVAAAKILPWQEGYARKLAENFEENIRVCSAHCECVLIQYFTTRHSDSWDNVPAFSYIGVSKLSCSACRIWLEAFNEAGQRKFYTGGSHGKWYWPWGMPTAEESLGEVMARESSGEVAPEKSLGETMAGKISLEYIKYLEERKLYRSGTDSTDATLSGGKRHLSNAQMESVRSRHAALKQKFGGTIARHLDSMPRN